MNQPYGPRFTGDRYYPPAPGSDGGQALVAELPARPTILTASAEVVNGKLRATFGPPRPGAAWLIRRVTITAEDAARCYGYVGDEQPQNIVMGSNTGTFDENDPNQPYFIPEGTPFLLIWQGVATGTALGRIEYVEI